MFRIGQKEVDAVARVIRSGRMFRHDKSGQCGRFERRYARFLGVRHVQMTASGTSALTAALIGAGVGPGQEVIVPAHTFMATPIAVLAAGAIPVVVDVDESITLDPLALEESLSRRTRAVIPVHMWGGVCDMGAIMRIARKNKLIVVEDACQCVGGAYEGKMVGSIGHAAGFSFNYYKNMTCGEGGAMVTNDDKIAQVANCVTDCCSFYWKGRGESPRCFVANGARASEFEGAMLNVQLDRLPAMIRALRRQKKRILRATAETALTAAPGNSLDHECGSHVLYRLSSAGEADAFASAVGGTVMGKTGRHTYNEWDPILERRGGHHPAMDPFSMPQNRHCRMKYSKDMCPRSLDLLSRTVMIGLHPDNKAADVSALISKIRRAARPSA